jgi:hypothetical protein
LAKLVFFRDAANGAVWACSALHSGTFLAGDSADTNPNVKSPKIFFSKLLIRLFDSLTAENSNIANPDGRQNAFHCDLVLKV